VRLFTRNGHDWSGRFPWIVESALKNRHRQFVIDGEAVILGVDGISDFNGLHSRQRDEEVQLYAFDVLALDGDDLRGLPLSLRKTNLAQLLRGRPDGTFSSHRSSRARSVPTCFAPPAIWASMAWCRSGLIGPIAPGDRRTG
jgi:ATP-dependent DNA ligase